MTCDAQSLPQGDRDDRLSALEERFTFQQRLIDELNEALVAHCSDLARMEKELAQCCATLDRLAASGGGGEDQISLIDERPPHY